MIDEAIEQLTMNQDLTYDEMIQVMDEIMDGKVSSIKIASLLTGLSVKNPTVEEIAGAAHSMREHAAEFEAEHDAIDIVGTGGDHSNSFNISTTTSLVLASMGIPVVKHGNRAASSKSGAADVLQALGFNIDLDAATSQKMLEDKNFTFLFAQRYHQAMKYVAPVRKELGIRTIFNILGPLANPAHAQSQLLGVYDAALLKPMAQVLQKLGVVNAKVIYGTDGLDEASISAPTKVVSVVNGKVGDVTTITPEEFGLKRYPKADIIGGTPVENAAITNAILAGEPGAKRDIVLLNAGLAINTIRPATSISEGIHLAAEAIDNGKPKQLLAELLEY
ncbi:anthranilate phosphoribosyltransferase (plasmid) [Nicoliella spurrieriana]|uniref:Anthranilate phosphoribosyltransferase n=1 Tax=Nicoliella spurrieriana TaxID=2925830 RepID=A0A976X4K5_9LACO|nr:anthranilate phosphoribosyltransferase [Nicoliella spurrieriana]UQS86008.1 anthranilate phosphoribosyltransferase [Nicoliella spurrieriana]